MAREPDLLSAIAEAASNLALTVNVMLVWAPREYRWWLRDRA